MRFIHIADVHLGARPDAGRAYSQERPQELWDTLEDVVRTCEEEQTDLLLVAGDLFHGQPLLRELKEVNALFSELTHTSVLLIAGNHDYIRQDSYYKTFEWAANVVPLFGQELEYVEFPRIQTAVYGLSYYSRENREPLYEEAFANQVQKYEILLAHGGDEKHLPFDKRVLEKSGFDYIALGHIHKPQALEKNRMIYAGALEPIDRNDVGLHGYIKGEITDRGVSTQWIPCASRSYFHLDVLVDSADTNRSVRGKIAEQITANGTQNIYKITLKGRRDPSVEFDLSRMDEYGNVVEILDESEPDYDFEALERENADNLIGKYIRQFHGCEEGSIEYQALYEGVEILLKNKN